MYIFFFVIFKSSKKIMKSPWTTITGIILSVVTIFGFIGLLDEDQVIKLQNVIPLLVEAIASIVLIFKAKD